jgi:two-component system LytT family response regulator
MTRFRVLVADDEPLARHMVAALLREDPEVASVIECADALEARNSIARDRPDIVFLDVEMPEATGLTLAGELASGGPVVVFVTAFSRYATDAFDVDASDYVLKPFADARLAEALQRAKRRVRQRKLGELATQLAVLSSELHGVESDPARGGDAPYLTRLSFRQDDRTVVLQTSEVTWIEAEDYYVRLHSVRGRHLVRTSLATLEARLDPREFLRVHRAAIVNAAHARELRDQGAMSVVLSDGTAVPVSRSRRATVESALRTRLRR